MGLEGGRGGRGVWFAFSFDGDGSGGWVMRDLVGHFCEGDIEPSC